MEDGDVPVGVTENAGGNILSENDAVSLYKNFYFIADVDVQGLPHLFGEDDPAQLVDTFQNSC